MFECLGCHDPVIYNQKLKDALPHFGVDPYDRIPDYDLSKKYKLKPEQLKKIKFSVEE